MKKSVIRLIIITAVILLGSKFAYAHGVIYETTPLSGNKIRITLKHSDKNETKGIVTTHYYLENAKVLNIGYELKAKGAETAFLNIDLSGAVSPVRIILTNIGKVDELPFKDIAGIEAQDYIRHLHDAGIVNGRPDGKFNPDKFITRAEFMVLMVNALKVKGDAANHGGYRDINNHWARSSMLLAVNAGLIKGYENKTLKPNNLITLAEVCSILSKSFTFKTAKNGIYSKLKQNAWYSDSVKNMFDADILKVNDSIYKYFDEQGLVNRANCAMLLSRALSTF